MSLDREQFRQALVRVAGGCAVQHDGWPCNTCFHALYLPLLEHDIHDYWLAVLDFRGDYADDTTSKQDALLAELLDALGVSA